jgi:hypothetical protein
MAHGGDSIFSSGLRAALLNRWLVAISLKGPWHRAVAQTVETRDEAGLNRVNAGERDDRNLNDSPLAAGVATTDHPGHPGRLEDA